MRVLLRKCWLGAAVFTTNARANGVDADLPLTKTLHLRRLNQHNISSLTSSLCPDTCEAYNCNSPECAQCEFSCGEMCAFRQENEALAVDTSAGTESGLDDPTSDMACSATMFDDVTSRVLRREEWYNFHSLGRPTKAETAPLFVDHNGDGVLDMFQGSHMRVLAESQNVDNGGLYELTDARHRIKMQNKNSDNHGSNILDLDGDGILDLLIAVGGGLGGLLLEGAEDDATDNMILWGEKELDADTGEMTTVFNGGIDAAAAAGISMRLSRGRFNYVFDANGDGLLDIYFAADRPRVDFLTPGILMINQGDRTWKKDHSVSEYSKAMILTDVDGDGFANEFVITRDHCYTQKLPPYPDDIVDFCMTRPVGSTAVYKFNQATKQMESIGKQYSPVEPMNEMQPPCCPLGKGDTFQKNHHNCFVQSTASGDFDQDQLADQVFLYTSKIVLYFSSDRPAGELPFGNQYIGAEIYLPKHCHGKALRVIDFDNDGKEELLVGCFETGTFLLYTRGTEKNAWTLVNGCNDGNALGDLTDASLAGINDSDMEAACRATHGNFAKELCLFAAGNATEDSIRRHTEVKLEGLTTVDLNNDGFMDVVVAYRNGHHLFLQNRPPTGAVNHRFIAIKLTGGTNGIGAYGIGATVILHADGCDGCSVQFREISSYQHATDKWGYKDDRIYFGLGLTGVPTKVYVRWPTGVVQREDIDDWAFEGSESSPVVISLKEESSSQPVASDDLQGVVGV